MVDGYLDVPSVRVPKQVWEIEGDQQRSVGVWFSDPNDAGVWVQSVALQVVTMQLVEQLIGRQELPHATLQRMPIACSVADTDSDCLVVC